MAWVDTLFALILLLLFTFVFSVFFGPYPLVEGSGWVPLLCRGSERFSLELGPLFCGDPSSSLLNLSYLFVEILTVLDLLNLSLCGDASGTFCVYPWLFWGPKDLSGFSSTYRLGTHIYFASLFKKEPIFFYFDGFFDEGSGSPYMIFTIGSLRSVLGCPILSSYRR